MLRTKFGRWKSYCDSQIAKDIELGLFNWIHGNGDSHPKTWGRSWPDYTPGLIVYRRDKARERRLVWTRC